MLKLFHVSERYLGHEVLFEPRVPKNQMTKLFGEDSVTPRICFCESIGRCLTALGDNIKGKVLHVYEIDIDEEFERHIKRPSLDEVPDVDTSGEIWLLKPCRLKLSQDETIIVFDGYDAYTKNKEKKYVKWNWAWKNNIRRSNVWQLELN